MLKTKKQEEYQSPLIEILEISSAGILCGSITNSESGAEGFVTDEMYGW